MHTVARRMVVVAVLLGMLSASRAFAHGMSDVEASYELTPPGAAPGDRVRLAVQLRELVAGAADGGRVTAAVTGAGTTERFELAAAGGLRHEGEFTLRDGTSDLRVFFERSGTREVALAGFRTGAALEMPPAKEREIYFVPTGKFDAIPWLDHSAGILVATLSIAGIGLLLRRSPTPPIANGERKPIGFLAIAAAGALAMAFGGYWDVSSHTTEGREGFFGPPHLVIYGGILLALLAVSVSLLKKPPGQTWKSHLLSDRAASFAAIAMLAQLSSGPFDELWHGLFGLDVSVWSPPHVVLIMGGVSVCLALSAIRVSEGRSATVLRALTLGGALLTAELFLAEYEFATPSWHPSQSRPVLLVVPGFLILFGAVTALVAKRALPLKFGATIVATVFLGLRLLVYPYLAIVSRGQSPSLSPWILAALAVAIAIDLAMPVNTRRTEAALSNV